MAESDDEETFSVGGDIEDKTVEVNEVAEGVNEVADGVAVSAGVADGVAVSAGLAVSDEDFVFDEVVDVAVADGVAVGGEVADDPNKVSEDVPSEVAVADGVAVGDEVANDPNKVSEDVPSEVAVEASEKASENVADAVVSVEISGKDVDVVFNVDSKVGEDPKSSFLDTLTDSQLDEAINRAYEAVGKLKVSEVKFK